MKANIKGLWVSLSCNADSDHSKENLSQRDWEFKVTAQGWKYVEGIECTRDCVGPGRRGATGYWPKASARLGAASLALASLHSGLTARRPHHYNVAGSLIVILTRTIICPSRHSASHQCVTNLHLVLLAGNQVNLSQSGFCHKWGGSHVFVKIPWSNI